MDKTRTHMQLWMSLHPLLMWIADPQNIKRAVVPYRFPSTGRADRPAGLPAVRLRKSKLLRKLFPIGSGAVAGLAGDPSTPRTTSLREQLGVLSFPTSHSLVCFMFYNNKRENDGLH